MKLREGNTIYEMPDNVYKRICDICEVGRSIGRYYTMDDILPDLEPELRDKITITRD